MKLKEQMEEKTVVFKRMASKAKDWQRTSPCDTFNKDATLPHCWQLPTYGGLHCQHHHPWPLRRYGATLKTSEDMGSALLQRFIQQSDHNNLDETLAVWKVLDIPLIEAGLINYPITVLGFTEALSGQNKDTAPGLDKVKILRHLEPVSR